MAITAFAALWFLPFALPICIWVAWSDLKYMKIPNKAVMALTVVFLVIGPFVLGFPTEYLWRIVHLIVVLVIGFALNMTGMIGAGDAKFAAAMAPFFPLGDMRLFMVLFGLLLIFFFILHRGIRRIPAITSRSPDWVSWTSKKFPMGLALGGGLAAYLVLGVIYGM